MSDQNPPPSSTEPTPEESAAPKNVSRRGFMKSAGFLAGGLVVGGAVGGVAGYYLGRASVKLPAGLKQGTGSFTIGASVTTSGPIAAVVSKEVDMFNSWVTMVNNRGGIYASEMGGYIPVKMIVLTDNGPSDPTTIRNNYNSLVSSGVDLMIGAFTASPSEVASPVAIQNGIPYIDAQAAEIPIFAQSGAPNWVVGSLNLINYWLWNYFQLLKTTDAKTIYFLDQGDDFTQGVNGTDKYAFGGVQMAKYLGFDVLGADTVNTTLSSTYDYTSEVQTIKSADPDVVVYSDTASFFSGLFWEACKKANYKPRAYHPIEGHQVAFQQATGVADQSGITADLYWDPSFPYEGLWGKSFWSQLQTTANFTDTNWPWLVLGYECLEIACEAVQVAGTTNKSSVMNALKSMEFTSIIGPWKTQNPLSDPFAPSLVLGSNTTLNTGIQMGLPIAVPVQVINGKRVILYPPDLATGTYQYPQPTNW
jgi:ABC-type branched-subunit amino acid transport system substrate-binding protein